MHEPGASRQQPLHVAGFRGDIRNIRRVPASVPARVEPVEHSSSPGDISLTHMASQAMNYLLHNPVPERGYECRFDIDLLGCPPSMWPGSRDPYITFGDTESRMDWEFIFMRDITGSDAGREAEHAIRRRIMGYLRDDGLSWLPPYCLNCDLSDHEPCAITWTTGATLLSLVEQYIRSGDDQTLALAKKLVGGLRSLASWDTGRAYYPGGMGGWRDGDWMHARVGYFDSYPCILEPITRYIEVTDDQEALDFAEAFADGMLADLQENLGANRILEDGSFAGYNCHLHMRAALGLAHLGALTSSPRYVEWARRAYDFMVSQGTDWGWFPESIGRPNSETCATGDMADVASRLAQAGYSQYWDHLERFVRNYIVHSQFFLTPEYQKLYRKVHHEQPRQAEQGLEQVRDFEGGFVARILPNSLTNGTNMSMMGCCPPEGMRTLHIAWRNVVTQSSRGVFVNLWLDRDAPEAKVVSFAPRIGRLSVLAKKSADFFLRPPGWAPRSEVKAFRQGKQVPASWKADHLQFEHVDPGEELTLIFPVLTFAQTVQVAGQTYTYHWVGNTVTSADPSGEILPLFGGQE